MITKAFMATASCAKLIIVITKYQHNYITFDVSIQYKLGLGSAKCDETKYDR